MRKKGTTMKKIVIIVIAILATLLSLPYAFTWVLMESWSTTHLYMQWVCLFLAVMVYVFVWANIIFYMKKEKAIKWKHQLMMGSTILLCGVIIVMTKGLDAWQHRFERISTEVDLIEYQPFQSEKVAKLDSEASLKIEAPVPIMDGATALYPIYAAYGQAIYPEKEYSPYQSEIMCSTTPVAYENLLKKQADIIFVAAPSKKQKAEFDKANEELVLTPIGKEGFVFFVNKDNPVESLTIEQIQDIYSGKITNWKDVGGEDEEIRAFQRPEGSGSQSALLRLMKDIPLQEAIKEDVPSGMGDIISKTAEYENRSNALGFSFRFYANEMVKNDKIKLLKINGIAPNEDTIRNESYPITNSFYAITLKSNTSEKVKAILDWIVSKEGKELVEKTGYVS